jgi:hypothetical protein
MRANMMYERIHLNEETPQSQEQPNEHPNEQPNEQPQEQHNSSNEKNSHTREYYIEADIRNFKFRAGYRCTSNSNT